MGVVRVIKNVVVLLMGIVLGWFIKGMFLNPLSTGVAQGNKGEVKSSFVAFSDISVSNDLGNKQIDNAATIFEVYLNKKEYDLAFNIIETYSQKDDLIGLMQLTDVLEKYNRQLWVNKDYHVSLDVLKRYLNLFNRDTKVRMLLVETYVRLQNYLTAIDELYVAKGHAYIQVDIDSINKKIRSLVKKQKEIFKENKNNLNALRFFEKLTQQEADYAPYFFSLAEAQINLGYVESANNSLQMIVNDAAVGFQANALLSKLKKAAANAETSIEQDEIENVSNVSLLKNGNNYYLKAYFNETDSARLLIDTGASVTVFTPEILNKFNQKFKVTGENRVFNTANGKVEAPMYRLNELIVGEMKVSDIEVAIIEMPNNSLAEGLLGMNFLQYFQFYIDQNNKLLHLSLRNK